MTQEERNEFLESLVRTSLGQASKALKMSKELRKACNRVDSEIALLKSRNGNLFDRIELAEAEIESLSSSIEFYSGVVGDDGNDNSKETGTPLDTIGTKYIPKKKEVAGYEFIEAEEVK